MQGLLKRLRSPVVVSISIGLFVALAIILVRSTGVFQRLELIAYDWQLRLRPVHSEPQQSITLITVTERDIRQLGWPLTDAILARVLRTIAEHQPRAVGFDIYRDLPVPPGLDELNSVLAAAPQIIGPTFVGNENKPGVPAPPALEGTDRVGFNDMVVDPDGVVRRGLLFVNDGKSTFYSFALRLALLYLQKEGITPKPDPVHPDRMRLGYTSIRPFESNDGGYVNADARGYQFLLNYEDARTEFPTFDLASLLAGAVRPEAIRDKIVLLGVVAESTPDIFHTPVTSPIRTGDTVYGVVLHANIVSQLLRFALKGSRATVTASETQEWLWTVLWSVMGAVLGLSVRSPLSFSAGAAGGLVGLGFVTMLAFLYAWWIPIVPPAFAWLASAMIVTAHMSNQEKLQRALLMQIFSRHVSPEVASTVWQQREEFLDGGRPRPQQLTVTVLFTDLVNFTAVSEKKAPEALLAWLNDYMEEMSQQVINDGGVINKYIGDSIMAIFGVPVPRKTELEIRQDAINAVSCGLHMKRELIKLNHKWKKENLPMVGMRIGIYTGSVAVGSLGGKERLEYTIIGDTVNTASRLEGFDKDSFVPDFYTNPCRIIVGESTYNCLGDEFQLERVGEVSLKGKDEKVTVYNVLN